MLLKQIDKKYRFLLKLLFVNMKHIVTIKKIGIVGKTFSKEMIIAIQKEY